MFGVSYVIMYKWTIDPDASFVQSWENSIIYITGQPLFMSFKIQQQKDIKPY